MIMIIHIYRLPYNPVYAYEQVMIVDGLIVMGDLDVRRRC